MDALVVFYFSFLSKEDKALYQSRLQLIYEKLTDEDGISALKTLQGSFKKTQHTEAGRKRKSSITEKLFHTRKETCLQLSLYSSALVYLRQYVMLFQQAEPAIYKLHDNQVRVIREFLACFIKPEILSQCNSISKLKKLDVEDPQHHLANSLLFIGKKGGNVRSKSKNKNKHDCIAFSSNSSSSIC